MGRKAVESGGKRDEIINVARELFFEKGFDGVTVRNVQKAVGCEVGLFYYYFKSKEQVFEVIFDIMEDEWIDAYSACADAEENPLQRLERIFECMEALSKSIKSEGVVHWSVEGALLDRLCGAAVPFVEKALEDISDMLHTRNGSSDELSRILSFGCGKQLFHGGNADHVKKNVKRLVEAWFDPSGGELEKRISEPGRKGDISVVLL